MRTIVLRLPRVPTEDAAVDAIHDLAQNELATCLNTLEQAIGDSRYPRTETNHIFFRHLAPLALTHSKLEAAITSALPPHHEQIKQCQASELELVVPLVDPAAPDAKPVSTRVVCRLAPSLAIHIFEELGDESLLASRSTQLRPISSFGSLTKLPSQAPPVDLKPYALNSLTSLSLT